MKKGCVLLTTAIIFMEHFPILPFSAVCHTVMFFKTCNASHPTPKHLISFKPSAHPILPSPFNCTSRTNPFIYDFPSLKRCRSAKTAQVITKITIHDDSIAPLVLCLSLLARWSVYCGLVEQFPV